MRPRVPEVSPEVLSSSRRKIEKLELASFGGFHSHGIPQKWRVHKGKSDSNGWFGGTPISGNHCFWQSHFWWSFPSPRMLKPPGRSRQKCGKSGRLVEGLTQHRDDIHLPHEGLRRKEGQLKSVPIVSGWNQHLPKYKAKNPGDLAMSKEPLVPGWYPKIVG